jgi:hypothetical protein
MTGFLHRLARRVVGPEPQRARTVARLPFSAPPAMEEQRAETPALTGAHLQEPLGTATPEPQRARTVTQLPFAEPPAIEEQRAETPRPTEAQFRGPPQTATPEPSVQRPATADRAASPPLLPSAPELRAERRRPMAPDLTGGVLVQAAKEAAPPSPSALVSDRPAESPELGNYVANYQDIGPALRLYPTKATMKRRDTVAAVAATPGAPEPLLPEVPSSTALPDQRPPAARVARQTLSSPGTPDVHVHIGRIEVASVVEPQPQPLERPRRSRKPPLSLDDYLAKRRSG